MTLVEYKGAQRSTVPLDIRNTEQWLPTFFFLNKIFDRNILNSKSPYKPFPRTSSHIPLFSSADEVCLSWDFFLSSSSFLSIFFIFLSLFRKVLFQRSSMNIEVQNLGQSSTQIQKLSINTYSIYTNTVRELICKVLMCGHLLYPFTYTMFYHNDSPNHFWSVII